MADQKSSARRRELALAEVHLPATQLLQDARTLAAGLEVICAEVQRATGEAS